MADYTDLIARLRQVVPHKQGFSGYYPDLDAIQAQQAEAADAIADLISRLRGGPTPIRHETYQTMTEAAAAIAALQAEVARLAQQTKGDVAQADKG